MIHLMDIMAIIIACDLHHGNSQGKALRNCSRCQPLP